MPNIRVSLIQHFPDFPDLDHSLLTDLFFYKPILLSLSFPSNLKGGQKGSKASSIPSYFVRKAATVISITSYYAGLLTYLNK